MSRNERITRRVLNRDALAVGAGVVAAACGPAQTPAGPARSAPGGRQANLRVHVVKKLDVSDWIERGLEQNIDDWNSKHPNIKVTLETHGGWTDTYVPQIIALSASNQLGDLVWYPPRHRSHLAWGTKFRIVRDLLPLAKAARYDLGQFYRGAIEHNTWEGKLYWLSYISTPITPVIAYNKTKSQLLGLPLPKDDWTFEELASWAQRGTVADTFGYFRGDSAGATGAGPYLRQWGVEPVDKTGRKATFLDKRDAFVQALTYRYNLMNVWKVSPNPAAGAINLDQLFGGQRLLAADIWTYRIKNWPIQFKEFEIDFFLTPVAKKGDKRRSMLTEHVFGVTSVSKIPDEAFQFLTWICGKEMNVQGVLQGQKGAMARPDVWGDTRILESLPPYRKLRPVMEAVEPDFVVANFRGEDFDSAYGEPDSKLERGQIPVLEAATEIQRLTQVVLDKEAP